MLTQSQVIESLRAHKSEIESRFGIVKLGIFGSFARNVQTEASDIDVVVEFAPNTPELWERKEALRLYIASMLGVQVDICREKYIKPLYRSTILGEAIYV